MFGLLRRILLGSPLATERAEEEKLGKMGGLAVFAADAMSSVAYGPEEIILVLSLAGVAGIAYTIPVAIAVCALIVIVATSYRQTVNEYPSGGGAYVVARENLGKLQSHIAGAALLTDYVLTVAVSVAAGTAAVASAWPGLHEYHLLIAVIFVVLIMLANLRGVRESAAMFAVPVYGFVACTILTVLVGLFRLARGDLSYVPPTGLPDVTHSVGLFLILRSFSSGCASLTGLEAVANGTQAFREPRGRNAAAVMTALAVVLTTTVLGVAILAHSLGIIPVEKETVLSQIGGQVFGRGTLYYLLQLLTTAVLVLAANTSFAGFPRLAAFMAKDGYMPRQLTNVGDRLVYSNGIIALAVLAIALIVGFHGEVTRLIPLYAVGVFTAFTLSQWGMVVHWTRAGGPQWRQKAIVNGFGAVCTGIVTLIVAVTKFSHGAWIVCLIIPALVLLLRAVRAHYDRVAARLSLDMADAVHPYKVLHVLLVGGMHRGTLEALQYTRALSGDIRAVHIEAAGDINPRIKQLWHEWADEIPLVVLPSPYRGLAGPLVDYIKKVRSEEGYDIVTVVLPEFVVDSWWESLLHNHSALWLQLALSQMPGVAVLNMRYKL